MIILHFDLQPQFIYELFCMYITSKCSHVIHNFGNYMENVPMLFTTLGITWGNVPMLFTVLGNTWGYVPMLFTTLGITWENVPILFTTLGITWGNVPMLFTTGEITWKMFPCYSQVWELLGEISHVIHNVGDYLLTLL